MNKNLTLKSTQSLVAGERFVSRGEVGTFVAWGPLYSNRWGVYRECLVTNADGHTVRWSLNVAGSVEVF